MILLHFTSAFLFFDDDFLFISINGNDDDGYGSQIIFGLYQLYII